MTSAELKEKYLEILYNKNKNIQQYENESDKYNFVIPFIATNNGKTVAQIRYETDGIYKDIQRAPFLRKTGIFDDTGALPDIDITSLVYYGTLQQARIAPTLENIDIKLYFREPLLKKVKSSANKENTQYADNYIWRELPAGFHVHNNDSLYGYEWIVLQDDYSGTDGIYNLHMNIEDGLGVCKFAGSSSPISLKGVQYKLVITAKNLWTREYSLMDSFPLLHSLESWSDDLAPTVKAIKDYYAAAVDTAKLVATIASLGEGNTKITKDGIETNLIETDDINVRGKTIVYQEDLDDHVKTTVLDPMKNALGETLGVHGIYNAGFNGNIHAKDLDGIKLGTGSRAVTKNQDSKAYIPFVNEDNIMGIGTVTKTYTTHKGTETDSKLVSTRAQNQETILALGGGDYFTDRFNSWLSDVKGYLKTISVSDKSFNILYDANQVDPIISVTSGNYVNNVSFKVAKVVATEGVFDTAEIAGYTFDETLIKSLVAPSTIAYKIPLSEYLPTDIKTAMATTLLTPNIGVDEDGNEVGNLDTANLEDSELYVSKDLKNTRPTYKDVTTAKNSFDKLGSALQALYELPLSTWIYKRGQEDYKQQLGILIERVNQVRDNLSTMRGTEKEMSNSNFLVHKRNTMVSSNHPHVKGSKANGFKISTTDQRVTENVFSYSDEEIKSIAHYLDLTTSKKELAIDVRNIVGILLKAAKETQERLLDIETSVYGWDSPTIPGDNTERKELVDRHIDEELQSTITNQPLLLGLNRLMRALCLEIFDTADLDKIEAEYESRVTDSETSKVSVKTRMDQIDEITSTIYNQCSALVRYYVENVRNDEGQHSYTDLYSVKNEQLITKTEALEEDTSLLDNVKDSRDGLASIDLGRTWKNLPAEEDITDEKKVDFGEVSKEAHTHTPKKEESGLVRIPSVVTIDKDTVGEGDIEHDDYSEFTEGASEGNPTKTTRTWDLLKVDKYKNKETDEFAANGTYKPFFKTKAVAWDSFKIERINRKLSEVTKTVYGVDDISAKLPNRTEVLRRNITNLVDDLYPNRSFSVEQKINISHDATADLYNPFKVSNKTVLSKGVASENVNEDEKFKNTHTSIIPYFDEEIFNFEVTNYFKGKNIIFDNLGGKTDYLKNKQIDISTTDKIKFDTSKLVTDKVPFDSSKYGTYFKAYSRIDLIESLIGIENCFIPDLFTENIFEAGGYTQAELNSKASGESTVAELQIIYNAAKAAYENAKSNEEALSKLKSDSDEKLAAIKIQKDSAEVSKNEWATKVPALKSEMDNAYTAKVKADEDFDEIKDSINFSDDITKAISKKEDTEKAYNDKVSEYNEKQAEIAEIESSIEAKRNEAEAVEENENQATIIQEMADSWTELKTLRENILEVNIFPESSFEENLQATGKEPKEQAADDFPDSKTYTLDKSLKISNNDTQRQVSSSEIANDSSGFISSDNKPVRKTGDGEIQKQTTVNHYIINGKYLAGYETKERLLTKTGTVYQSVTKDMFFKDNFRSEKVPTSLRGYTEISTVTQGFFTDLEDGWYFKSSSDSEDFYKVSKISTAKDSEDLVTDETKIAELKEVDFFEIEYCEYSYKEVEEYQSPVYDTKDVEVSSGVYNNLTVWTESLVEGGKDLNPATSFYTEDEVTYTILSKKISPKLEWVSYSGAIFEEVVENVYELNFVQTVKDQDLNVSTTQYFLRYGDVSGLDTEFFKNDISTFTENLKIESKILEEAETLNNVVKGTFAYAYSFGGDIYQMLKENLTSCKKELDILSKEVEETLKAKNEAAQAYAQLLLDNESTLGEYNDRLSKKEAASNTYIEAVNAYNGAVSQLEYFTNIYNNALSDYNNELTQNNSYKESLATAIEDTALKKSAMESAESDLNIEKARNVKLSLPHFRDELSFRDFTNNGLKCSEDILNASNVSFVISRKEKKIQERITTTESFLDSLSKAVEYGNNISKAISAQTGTLNPNTRFETVDSWTTLKRVMDSSEHKESPHRVFDLDLAESFTDSLKLHNEKVWQKVAYSTHVEKSVFVTLPNNETYTGYYTISGVFAADPTLLPYQDYAISKGSSWTIKVYYVRSGKSVSSPSKDTIYLKGKVAATDGLYTKFASNNTNANSSSKTMLTGADSWQDQTEYNIYKMMNNLMNSLLEGDPADKESLYYRMMLKEHPVGSVYISMDGSENPAKRFGGTWSVLGNGYLLPTTGTPSNFKNAENGIVVVESATNWVPYHNHTKSGTITARQASHYHSIWSSNDDFNNSWAKNQPSGGVGRDAGYQYHSDSWYDVDGNKTTVSLSGGHHVENMSTDVKTPSIKVTDNTVISGSGTDTTQKMPTSAVQHYNVKAWVRVGE